MSNRLQSTDLIRDEPSGLGLTASAFTALSHGFDHMMLILKPSPYQTVTMYVILCRT